MISIRGSIVRALNVSSRVYVTPIHFSYKYSDEYYVKDFSRPIARSIIIPLYVHVSNVSTKRFVTKGFRCALNFFFSIVIVYDIKKKKRQYYTRVTNVSLCTLLLEIITKERVGSTYICK